MKRPDGVGRLGFRLSQGNMKELVASMGIRNFSMTSGHSFEMLGDAIQANKHDKLIRAWRGHKLGERLEPTNGNGRKRVNFFGLPVNF